MIRGLGEILRTFLPFFKFWKYSQWADVSRTEFYGEQESPRKNTKF